MSEQCGVRGEREEEQRWRNRKMTPPSPSQLTDNPAVSTGLLRDIISEKTTTLEELHPAILQ